jgi:hypothetical protein
MRRIVEKLKESYSIRRDERMRRRLKRLDKTVGKWERKNRI